MKTMNIKFCDRRRIKRLKRKKFLVNPEGFTMSFDGRTEFKLSCDATCYASDMVVFDKNYFFKMLKMELSNSSYKTVLAAAKSQFCTVSITGLKDRKKRQFVSFVFDNERSYIKSKLRS